MRKMFMIFSAATVIITAALLTITITAIPALAIDTSSANVTYVYTDNFTVTIGGPLIFDISANTTSIEEALMAAAEGGAHTLAEEIISEIFNPLFSLSMIAGIVGLAYWHRDKFLYMIAGFGLLLYGFGYPLGLSSTLYFSIMLVLIGIYSLVKMGDKRE